MKVTQADVAVAVGLHPVSYQKYEHEKAKKRKIFEKLAVFYGCSLDWLTTGEGVPFPDQAAECSNESPSHQVIPIQSDFPADDFVFIRQVNGKISAGGGLMPDNSADLQCAFRKDWVKRKGGKPDNMSLIKVEGDSMEPTLLDGDLVLVNHSRTTVAPQGGIYAISIHQEIMIKRVQILFPHNKLRILSDNTNYKPIEADPEQIKINGKVIWFGRDMDK